MHQSNNTLRKDPFQTAVMPAGELHIFSTEDRSNYIISLLIPLGVQTHVDVHLISGLQKKMIQIDGTHHYYPESALHISVVGCTPFFANRSSITTAQIDNIKRICRNAIMNLNQKKLAFHIKGLHLNNYSTYLRVFPTNENFKNFRRQITTALKKTGELPIEKNEDEIRLNILRFGHKDKLRIRNMLSDLGHWRHIDVGIVEIDILTLCITNQVFSLEQTEHLCLYKFTDVWREIQK